MRLNIGGLSDEQRNTKNSKVHTHNAKIYNLPHIIRSYTSEGWRLTAFCDDGPMEGAKKNDLSRHCDSLEGILCETCILLLLLLLLLLYLRLIIHRSTFNVSKFSVSKNRNQEQPLKCASNLDRYVSIRCYWPKMCYWTSGNNMSNPIH